MKMTYINKAMKSRYAEKMDGKTNSQQNREEIRKIKQDQNIHEPISRKWLRLMRHIELTVSTELGMEKTGKMDNRK